MMLIATYYVFI